jgi:alpha-tubulin suppressor-like RCC1 family protein
VIGDGTVRCLALNDFGQPEDGSTFASNVPVTVTGISTARGVSVGSVFSCALLADETARCWGGNNSDSSGVLGNCTNSGSLTPVPVIGLSSATSLSSGHTHTCARLTSGMVRCWGNAAGGQIGMGPDVCDGSACAQAAIAMGELSNVTHLTSGQFHTCAALADGTLRCWGSNDSGQLGNGGVVSSPA